MMPALTPQQQILRAAQIASASEQARFTNLDSVDDSIWTAEQQGDVASEETGLAVPLGKDLNNTESINGLRLSTYSQPELHDRYMSSEEESSPSPNSETGSLIGLDLELDCVTTKEDEHGDKENDEPLGLLWHEVKTEVAVAMPILAAGRPKLIDITNLAPMHKRKRSSSDRLHQIRPVSRLTSSRITSSPAEAAKEDIKAKIENRPSQNPQARSQSSLQAPESWLPEEVLAEPEDSHEDIAAIGASPSMSFFNFDTNSLPSPQPSPRAYQTEQFKTPGSVSRARKHANPPRTASDNRSSFKGIGRTLSSAKREEAYHPSKQFAKKTKMVARGPCERFEAPLIPPFPFDGPTRVGTL